MERNEDVIIEILSEIAKKSDGKNPVNIDLSDEIRRFHFDLIHQEGRDKGHYIQYFKHKVKFSDPESLKSIPREIQGLTPQGHLFLNELIKSRQREKHERGTYLIARAAFIISIISLIVNSVPAGIAFHYILIRIHEATDHFFASL